jgi:hypothetical protein
LLQAHQSEAQSLEELLGFALEDHLVQSWERVLEQMVVLWAEELELLPEMQIQTNDLYNRIISRQQVYFD